MSRQTDLLPGRKRQARNVTRLMHYQHLPLLRRNQPQLFSRHLRDPLRSRQRRKLHLQLIPLSLQQYFLDLQSFDLITQPNNIDTFPHKHENQQHTGHNRQRLHECPPLDTRWAARNLALRDRRFRSDSALVGICGFLVSTTNAGSSLPESARNVCFTIRSSSEWNEITQRRPPGDNTSTASRNAGSRQSSS